MHLYQWTDYSLSVGQDEREGLHLVVDDGQEGGLMYYRFPNWFMARPE